MRVTVALRDSLLIITCIHVQFCYRHFDINDYCYIIYIIVIILLLLYYLHYCHYIIYIFIAILII